MVSARRLELGPYVAVWNDDGTVRVTMSELGRQGVVDVTPAGVRVAGRPDPIPLSAIDEFARGESLTALDKVEVVASAVTGGHAAGEGHCAPFARLAAHGASVQLLPPAHGSNEAHCDLLCRWLNAVVLKRGVWDDQAADVRLAQRGTRATTIAGRIVLGVGLVIALGVLGLIVALMLGSK